METKLAVVKEDRKGFRCIAGGFEGYWGPKSCAEEDAEKLNAWAASIVTEKTMPLVEALEEISTAGRSMFVNDQSMANSLRIRAEQALEYFNANK